EYLDPLADDLNPFLHYLLVGRSAGHEPVGVHAPPRADPPVADETTRRICLFAAYDLDGTVDDYVVEYLTDLSRHADIYYLADSRMSDHELAKLSEVTKGAWAIEHGRYDYGSYSILAEELVGWDVIDTYDEL